MKNRKRILPSCVFDEASTPVGKLKIIASHENIQGILWEHEALGDFERDKNHPIILKAKQQLEEYFNGARQNFDLPLNPRGTDFQMKVWQLLREIPYGQTISYGEQARRVGDKNKARAVGMANGQNPIPVVIPCHRVIGTKGKLTGFGGGLDNKAWLLAHEQKIKGEA